MQVIARDYATAAEAGLTLCGQDKDGAPEWLGTKEQFRRWNELQDWVDQVNCYPWVDKIPF